MNASTPLYLQLLGFFRQYSRAKDWRHLKTLGWMVSALIGSGKLSLPAWEPYVSYPVNPCYFCKSELHDTLKPLALELGYQYVLDGVNADDLQDYRPGIQAAQEPGARSPLAELIISKMEVRDFLHSIGLSCCNKPAQPCLSSRFPYGEDITIPKLNRVGRAEIYLRKLGYENVRVRSSGDTAKIELPVDMIQKFVAKNSLTDLLTTFQSFGFMYVTLDLEGYRSGKLNQVLLV